HRASAGPLAHRRGEQPRGAPDRGAARLERPEDARGARVAHRPAGHVPRAHAARRAARAAAAAPGALRAHLGRGPDLSPLLAADLGRQGVARARGRAAHRPVVDARGGDRARAARDHGAEVGAPSALPAARPVNILDRYIVRTILGSVLMVLCVVLIVGALVTFIDQQKDIGSGHYTSLSALWFTVLNLPLLAFEILPIAGLIGALLGLGTLARGSELTVIRASGISIARLAGITLIAGLVLVVVAVLLGEFIGPVLQQEAREQKAFARLSNVAFGGGA